MKYKLKYYSALIVAWIIAPPYLFILGLLKILNICTEWMFEKWNGLLTNK